MPTSPIIPASAMLTLAITARIDVPVPMPTLGDMAPVNMKWNMPPGSTDR
jgi:hypothetical protein